MNADKIFDVLTTEIITKLDLPPELSPIIKKRIEWAYIMGLETGKRHFAGIPKTVIQLTKRGRFIKEWESVTIAARILDIHPSHIFPVCLKRKKYKTAGGFKWEYAEEYYKRIQIERELNTISL